MSPFMWLGLFVALLVAVSTSVPLRSSDSSFKWNKFLRDVDAQLSASSETKTNDVVAMDDKKDTEEVKLRQRRDASLEESTSNLQNRSVCPWTYSINTDSNRIPANLPEASCTRTSIDGTTNKCEHVYFFVPVQVNSTWTWIKMKVGCTLATPTTQPADTPSTTLISTTPTLE